MAEMQNGISVQDPLQSVNGRMEATAEADLSNHDVQCCGSNKECDLPKIRHSVYIAGMSARFPGGRNVKELWKTLMSDSHHPDTLKQNGHGASTSRGFLPNIKHLEEVDRFDADFWNLTDTEADVSNPVLRHLLEVVYEAILDSGLTLSELQSDSTPTGLFLAASTELDGLISSQECRGFYTPTSSELPGVISQMFGLYGPAMLVDSGSSSSLTALSTAVSHISCRNLQYAIVAGGHLALNPEIATGLGHMLDQCGGATFIQADGVVAVVLVRENVWCPRIYSQILGAAVSSDGSDSLGAKPCDCQGLTQLVHEVCETSDVQPADIVYLEGGTLKEVKQLMKGLQLDIDQRPVIVTCSSSVIGHCGPVSGLQSLIVTLLAMHHGCVPSSITVARGDDLEKVEENNNEKKQDRKKHTDSSNFPDFCAAGTGAQVLKDGPMLITGRGCGGTNACLILKPFRCSGSLQDRDKISPTGEVLQLLPLCVRGKRGFDCILEAIDASCTPDLLHLFRQSLFVSDRLQPARGYMIVSHARNVIASEVCSCQEEVLEPEPAIMLFGDFSSASRLAVKEMLGHIPAVDESVQKSLEILDQLGCGQFCHIGEKSLATNSLGIPRGKKTETFHDFEHILLWTVAQIAIADVMTQMCGRQVWVCGAGLGVLAAAYHNSCLTRCQCLQLAHCLAVNLQKWSQSHGKDYTVLRVSLNVDEIYRLGPRVQVLAVFPVDMALIGVQTDSPGLMDRVTHTICQMGGSHDVVAVGPIFNPLLKSTIKDLLFHQFHRIIPHPQFWSEGYVHAPGRRKPVSLADITCSVDYLLDVLTNRVDHVSILQGLTAEATALVVSCIPGCFDTESAEEEWVLPSSQQPHCRFPTEDVLTMLGKMHLHGVNLDLAALDKQKPHTLDCSAPPISPLVSWNHTQHWSLPLWTDFFYRMRDEYIVHHFVLAGGRELEEYSSPAEVLADLLYRVWIAVVMRHKSTDVSELEAVQLYNLRLHQRLEELAADSFLSIHPQLGRKAFIVFDDDCVWMSGNFELVDEMTFRPDHGEDDCWEEVECEQYSYQAVAMVTGSWPELITEVLSYLGERYYHSTWWEQCPQLVPDVVTFLPQLHAQELLDADIQNTLVCRFEKFTGMSKVGGLHIQLPPITREDTDTYTSPASTIMNAASVASSETLPPANKDRQCVYDKATGCLQITVQPKTLCLSPLRRDVSVDKGQSQGASPVKDETGNGHQKDDNKREEDEKGGSEGKHLSLQLTDISMDKNQSQGPSSGQREKESDDARDNNGREEIQGSEQATADLLTANKCDASVDKSPSQGSSTVQHKKDISHVRDEDQRDDNEREDDGVDVADENLQAADDREDAATDENQCDLSLQLADLSAASWHTVDAIGDADWEALRLQSQRVALQLSGAAKELERTSTQSRTVEDPQQSDSNSRKGSLIPPGFSFPHITVSYAEVVTLSQDAAFLLYLGRDLAMGESVAGIWSPESPQMSVYVPVPGSFEADHLWLLPLWLMAGYIVMHADIKEQDSVLVHAPISALSATLLLQLGYVNHQVYARDDRKCWDLEHIFPKHRPLQSASSDQLQTHERKMNEGSCSVCVSWTGCNTSLALNQLSVSGHLIQFGIPDADTVQCLAPPVSKNVTITALGPLHSLRRILEYMSKHGDSDVPCVTEYDVPSGSICETILSLGLTPSLGSGFEQLQSAQFEGHMTLKGLLMSMDSSPEQLPHLLPDVDDDDLDKMVELLLAFPGQTADMDSDDDELDKEAGEETSEEDHEETDSEDDDSSSDFLETYSGTTFSDYKTCESHSEGESDSPSTSPSGTSVPIQQDYQRLGYEDHPSNLDRDYTACHKRRQGSAHEEARGPGYRVTKTMLGSYGQQMRGRMMETFVVSNRDLSEDTVASSHKQSSSIAQCAVDTLPKNSVESTAVNGEQSTDYTNSDDGLMQQEEMQSDHQQVEFSEDDSNYTDRHPSDSVARSPWFCEQRVSSSSPYASPWLADNRSCDHSKDQSTTVPACFVGCAYFETYPSDSETQDIRYFKRFSSDALASDFSDDSSFSQQSFGGGGKAAGSMDISFNGIEPAGAEPQLIVEPDRCLETLSLSTCQSETVHAIRIKQSSAKHHDHHSDTSNTWLKNNGTLGPTFESRNGDFAPLTNTEHEQRPHLSKIKTGDFIALDGTASSETYKEIDLNAVQEYVSTLVQDALKRVKEELHCQKLDASAPFLTNNDSFQSHIETTSTPYTQHDVSKGRLELEEKELVRAERNSFEDYNMTNSHIFSASSHEDSDESSVGDHHPELTSEQLMDLADALQETPLENSASGLHDQAIHTVSDVQDSMAILHLDEVQGEYKVPQHYQGLRVGCQHRTGATAVSHSRPLQHYGGSEQHDVASSLDITSSDASSGRGDLTSSDSDLEHSRFEPRSNARQRAADTAVMSSDESVILQDLTFSQDFVGEIFDKYCPATRGSETQDSDGFHPTDLHGAESLTQSLADSETEKCKEEHEGEAHSQSAKVAEATCFLQADSQRSRENPLSGQSNAPVRFYNPTDDWPRLMSTWLSAEDADDMHSGSMAGLTADQDQPTEVADIPAAAISKASRLKADQHVEHMTSHDDNEPSLHGCSPIGLTGAGASVPQEVSASGALHKRKASNVRRIDKESDGDNELPQSPNEIEVFRQEECGSLKVDFHHPAFQPTFRPCVSSLPDANAMITSTSGLTDYEPIHLSSISLNESQDSDLSPDVSVMTCKLPEEPLLSTDSFQRLLEDMGTLDVEEMSGIDSLLETVDAEPETFSQENGNLPGKDTILQQENDVNDASVLTEKSSEEPVAVVNTFKTDTDKSEQVDEQQRSVPTQKADSFLQATEQYLALPERRLAHPSGTGLQKFLSVCSRPVLQQLSEPSPAWTTARPLYLVHPITGTLDILQDLAAVLSVRCFGIQRTGDVPTTSIEDVAGFYCAAIKQQDYYGPYRLAGYSYGGLIAFEMARQFQREGRRVELLLMLDGSPHYIKAQVDAAHKHMRPDAGEDEVRAVTEAHFLLYFISLYATAGNKELMRAVLEGKETKEERVQTAVDFTIDGHSSTAKGLRRWLGRRRSKAGPDQYGGCSLQNMADSFIRLRRQQKACDFLNAAFMADKFDARRDWRFIGDIHLLRIKKSPEYCPALPVDYGLSGLCSGSVQIHHVSGDHESMLRSPHVESLASVIQSLLKGPRIVK